jgi:uncharacterized protein
MAYWDTSALVKLYAKASDSAAFEAQAVNPAITSRIALYEAHATFIRKEAEALLQPGSAEKLHSELLQDVVEGEWRLVELGTEVEQEYGQVLALCYQQSPIITLRALDALHLASARVAGETNLVATDKRMRAAAKRLGFSLFPA